VASQLSLELRCQSIQVLGRLLVQRYLEFIVTIPPLLNNHSTIVTSLEMFQKTLEESIVGDNVGILLGDVQRKNIRRGMIIAKPGTVKPHIRFEADVYILRKEEGGCHSPFFPGCN